MDLNLKNKIVLVTGASRGIGSAICRAFASEGAFVAINYSTSRDAAYTLSEELQKEYNVKTVVVKANMADETEVNEMIDVVERELGVVDILVNNAAVCPSGPLVSYTTEVWEKTFAVNMTGVFMVTRRVVSKMLDTQKVGSIVNVSSQAAFRGSTTGHLPYDSSKGALVSFTIALARELAQKGIRVNGVAPGLVRTEMVAKTWEEKKDRYLQTIPLHRIAETSEIANIVLFLASEKASYITGSTIDATGGMLMR